MIAFLPQSKTQKVRCCCQTLKSNKTLKYLHMRANGTDAQTIKMQAALRRNFVVPWSYRTHITRCMRFAPQDIDNNY